jgi:hypothetical protein
MLRGGWGVWGGWWVVGMDVLKLLLLDIIFVMYLSSFYKIKFEKYVFNSKIFLPFAGPVAAWGNAFKM